MSPKRDAQPAATLVIEFEISYLVEKARDTWQILSYISQSDQDEEMKREGLV